MTKESLEAPTSDDTNDASRELADLFDNYANGDALNFAPTAGLPPRLRALTQMAVPMPGVRLPLVPSQPLRELSVKPTELKIQNVVATAYVGCEIDLVKMSRRARCTEYNPRRFSALIMRIREPRSTALIFRTGRIVITGTKSTAQAVAAARKFARIVQLVGHSVKFQKFLVRNIVVSGDCHHEVRLGLFLAKNESAVYEPELFPGLIYRLETPRAVVLIFQNGKVIITGTKNEEDAQAAYSHVIRMIDDVYLMPISTATMLSAIRRDM